jgi:hypothetical protein
MMDNSAAAKVDLQLDRIRELQAAIHQVIQDESLHRIEELVAELGSRLATVLGILEEDGELQTGYREAVADVLIRQRELLAIGAQVSAQFKEQLGKTHEAVSAASKYAFSDPRLEAKLRISKDLIG